MSSRNDKFDTRLLINRSRQVLLGIIIVVAVICFAFFIHEGQVNSKNWFMIGLPLCLVGFFFILFPATESWNYSPWQSRPQQIEQSSEK